MNATDIKLFSIAPYRILPANTGGQLGIVSMHNALGAFCKNHIIGTTNNGPADGYAFTLHPILSEKPIHYLPGYKIAAQTRLARKLGATHIFCDHPYMAPAAIGLSKRLGIPWFLRSHNIESLRFKALGKSWWRILYSFEKMAMRNADGIFFITPEDRAWAIEHYKAKPALSHLIPYGTLFSATPVPDAAAKNVIAASTGLDPSVHWFYFLGVHSYKPNADAVRFIITEVVPRLQETGLKFHVLIGGKGLPEDLQALIRQTNGVAKYLGFVEDLDLFIKACDTMLNPVTTGGGIKTKAVEALGYNKVVVSTINGAAGISLEVCGDNLLLSVDEDWDAFAKHCIEAIQTLPAIPDDFYRRYYWGAIAQGVLDIIGNEYHDHILKSKGISVPL